MTRDYTADDGLFLVRVTSTMEALGDQPWMVTIIPDNPILSTGSYVIESESGLGAATEALDQYKEAHGLNPTTAWAL